MASILIIHNFLTKKIVIIYHRILLLVLPTHQTLYVNNLYSTNNHLQTKLFHMKIHKNIEYKKIIVAKLFK